jgi:hypothetical protein
MNTIRAVLNKSDYGIYEDYLNIRIDDYFLDEKLDEMYPGQEFKGLVPTLNFWLNNPDESKVVWERIHPKVNQKSICPVLMCPDDADFTCTLIVADILSLNNVVIWERLGLDKTADPNPKSVGSVVDWFDKIGPLCFDVAIYKQSISEFKMAFDRDRAEWGKYN